MLCSLYAYMQLKWVLEANTKLQAYMLEHYGHLLGPTASVRKAAIMSDAAKAHAKGPQCPHTDFQVDGLDAVRRAILMPMEAKLFSILLYPQSHTVLRKAAMHHRWTLEQGFKHSSADLDMQFARRTPLLEPVRLYLEDTHVLIFDCFLVHAGDFCKVPKKGHTPQQGGTGLLPEGNLRLHLYITPADWQTVNKGEELDDLDKLTTAPTHYFNDGMVCAQLHERFVDIGKKPMW